MNTILRIFLSYFRQPFVGTLSFVAALFLFGSGLTRYFTADVSASAEYRLPVLFLFYSALISLSFSMANHLRLTIRTPATLLWPRYRCFHLLTATVLLLVFIAVPCFLVNQTGFSIWPVIALYLYSATMIISVVFRFGDHPLSLITILWVLRFVYEVLGFPVNIGLFTPAVELVDSVGLTPVSMFLALITFTVLAFFAHRFLRIPLHLSLKDESDIYTREYDRPSASSERLLIKILARSKNTVNKRQNLENRLASWGIFSPVYSLGQRGMLLFLGLCFVLSLQYIGDGEFKGVNWIMPMAFFTYNVFSVMLSVDFLQHRHRLAVLWLQTSTRNRNTFAGNILKVYFAVAVRDWAGLSVGWLAVLLLYPEAWPVQVMQIIVGGLLILCVTVSLSLLLSDEISTHDARGWMLGGMIVSVLLLIVYFNIAIYINWPILGICSLATLLVMIAAGRRWRKTEFSFPAPQ